MTATLSPLPVVIGARIVIPWSAPSALLDRMRQEVTIPNPAFAKLHRLGKWTGGTPRTICGYVETDAGLELPRGIVREAQAVAAELGVPLAFDNRTLTLPDLPLTPTAGLRPYQVEAVEALVRGVQGIVVAPCGSGKTVIGSALVRAVRQPSLILVPALDLAEQWRSALDGCGVGIGFVGDGTFDVQPVTIGTVQTLAGLDPERFAALASSFGLVILDECHHAPAATFAGVLDRLPARRRIGLTATPDRADGLGALLGWYIGPTLFEVGHAELVEAGHLVPVRVRVVETGCAPFYSEETGWHATVDELVADPERNALLLQLVERDAREGHTSMVLTCRVAHAEHLASALLARGVSAGLLAGKVPAKRRAEILDGARAGRVRVLVATQVADEGLDIPGLSRVILAGPTRAAGRTIQRIGRAMRPSPGKPPPEILDLLDDCPVLRAQFYSRRRAYRTAGAEVVMP